jgi:hypothetical protein
MRAGPSAQLVQRRLDLDLDALAVPDDHADSGDDRRQQR